MRHSLQNINIKKQRLLKLWCLVVDKSVGSRQMKNISLAVICFCSIQISVAQEEDGVVSLSLPVRNSLTFNRYIINPTFSFVREQNKYVSLYNKREWVQFENAPQTYLASYSGRFAENIGAGLGLFQQNYGVLTTFGGVLNFAYNARLERDSNLTFGLNLGVYKSGVNAANVVTNFPDPSLDKIPSNLLLTINPGINYGTTFLDFGVSVNNLVLYNVQSSELIQDDPRQTIQAHVMYTGYFGRGGFFDEAKFSGLLRSEFGKETTTIAGIAMLTVPKGIWAQVGYNTLYGASAGLGLNITSQIAIEYNFEKALGDLTDFGPSHEITLAFKFNKRTNYDYSDEDEISAIFSSGQKRVLASSQPKIADDTKVQMAAEAAAKREELRERAKEKADTRAQLAAEVKAKQDAAAEENRLKQEVEAKAKQEAEALAQKAREAQAQVDAENKAKTDPVVKAEQEAKARLATVEKAKADAKARAEAQAKFMAEAQADIAAKAKAKSEQEARVKLAVQENAKTESKEQLDAANKARAEAAAKIKAEAEAKIKLAAQEKAKADEKARVEAQAKLAAEAKAKTEAEAAAKLAAETKAKAEQEKDRLAAQEKAKADEKARVEAQAKLTAEAKAKTEAEAAAKLAAETKAKAEQEKDRLAAQEKAKAEEKARLEAESKAKAEAAAEAKVQAEQKATVNPTDALGISMKSIADLTEASKNAQQELLTRFSEVVASKDKDLKDLKEENDLSEKGIYRAPRAFKSITEENNALEAIKTELDNSIETNNKRIKELENLYAERSKVPTLQNDAVNLYYQKTLNSLKAEQLKAIQTRTQLTATLKQINEATEFERKRRIKRAAYTNEEDRFVQDRSTLKVIRQNTPLSPVPLKAADFDFGEEQSSNIQILKNIKNVESGFYVVVAVHNDVAKRDAFLTKAVAAGQSNIDFFYDVNTSKYFIYYQKLDSIEAANDAMKTKGNQPYNGKLSIIKIENQ